MRANYTIWGLTFPLSGTASIILSLALMLLAGFLMTRLTKLLRLPNVTAYIFSGILIGPYVLNLVPYQIFSGMEFITDMALAIIAFGVGRYLKFAKLKKLGGKVIVITLFEALTTALITTLTMLFLFRLPLDFALLLGAISASTAPASTIMTIRQYKAKGDFVDLILQIMALDNAVALLAFSVCTAFMKEPAVSGGFRLSVLLLPLALNLAAVVCGILLGLILNRLIHQRRTQDNRLMLGISLLLVMTGLCDALSVSPFLSCMALGITYINAGGRESLFTQIDGFSPPILTLFFVLSGMRLNLDLWAGAGVIGTGYFFVRILGKYLGARCGSAVCKMPGSVKKYLGLALIPQAGVSIGLAMTAQRMLPAESSALISVIILSSAVLFEIIGPGCAKLSLFLCHCICREPEAAAAGDSFGTPAPMPALTGGASSTGTAEASAPVPPLTAEPFAVGTSGAGPFAGRPLTAEAPSAEVAETSSHIPAPLFDNP